jgi:hypothetical protein
MPNDGVYVLLVQNNEFYVGKSTDIEARIEQHINGEGCSFIQEVVKRVYTQTPCMRDWESWERAETLHWMHLHGISKVRGWMFTTPKLTTNQKKDAFRQICEKYDYCRTCGQPGHFMTDCRTHRNIKPDWCK